MNPKCSIHPQSGGRHQKDHQFSLIWLARSVELFSLTGFQMVELRTSLLHYIFNIKDAHKKIPDMMNALAAQNILIKKHKFPPNRYFVAGRRHRIAVFCLTFLSLTPICSPNTVQQFTYFKSSIVFYCNDVEMSRYVDAQLNGGHYYYF